MSLSPGTLSVDLVYHPVCLSCGYLADWGQELWTSLIVPFVTQLIGSQEPFVSLLAVTFSASHQFYLPVSLQVFPGWYDKGDAQLQQQNDRRTHLHRHQSQPTSGQSSMFFSPKWGELHQWCAWRHTENVCAVGAFAGRCGHELERLTLNPFTVPTCKISGLKDAQTCL